MLAIRDREVLPSLEGVYRDDILYGSVNVFSMRLNAAHLSPNSTQLMIS